MSSKRVRGKNFSEQEKHALIDLVLLNKDILQDKKKDAATWRRKAETWKRLTIEFRAQTGTDRSCAALREKYDNMKKNFRNKYRGVKNWDKEKEPNSAGNSWCSMSSTSENNGKYNREIAATPLETQFDSNGNFQLLNVAKEKNRSISSKNSDMSLLQQENMDDIGEPEIDSLESLQDWATNEFREFGFSSLQESVEQEQLKFLKLQQQYFRDQNSRAAEKHKYEVEKHTAELQIAQLNKQLIELEIELKRDELSRIKTRTLS
ncbi:uncharacterized protein LOC108114001 isoform X1 [Drosophila eugracilis]|uniref:uncharacterized protein LOC108114001 isoform X1 n=1 Tax=Drosophila eugracilis TaxID=29029 RepID=UPI0007E81B53|nr:uncharacterized protein LOC108114001 isoform X1 [Drosophila eugracilis]